MPSTCFSFNLVLLTSFFFNSVSQLRTFVTLTSVLGWLLVLGLFDPVSSFGGVGSSRPIFTR